MVNILVVDDHSTSLRLVSFILQQNNYQTSLAMNGLQALDCLAEQYFDLVITDLYMPELDGFGLLQCMRSNERYRTIPVIVLTGNVHGLEQMSSQESRGMAFLTKPIGSDELLKTIERLLAVRVLDQPGSVAAAASEPGPEQVGSLGFLGLRFKKKIHMV